MKKNIIFKYLVLITSTLIWNVRCGTVTTDKEEMTVKKGTTVSFTWTITPAAGESLAGLTISNGTYIEKDESNRLWKNTAPKIYPKTTEIFGDRFVVDDNIQGKLTVTIKSINYTEAMTLNLRVIFLDGLTASEALSNIQVIVQEDAPTTSDPTTGDDDSSGSNVGAIVGGVVAAVVVLAIIIGYIYWKSIRKGPNRNNRTGSSEDQGFVYHKEQTQYAKPGEVVPPPQQTEQPKNKKYDELGPGGRTGPKDHVVRSEYAQVKEADSEPEEDGNMVSDSIIV